MNRAIALLRLVNQRITKTGPRDVAALVSWFGAVQAQDYSAARWALGLRMPAGATAATIDRAIDAARIVRTHVMRPTWHFVAASDVHWMLELTADRVRQKLAFAFRYYELDAGLRVRATSAIEQAVGGGAHLTRNELAAHLARSGMAIQGVRLALLTIHAEVERVLCSGRQRGGQATYALLAARAPRPRRLSRDEAIAELAGRYFSSHGPATVRDFAWWSGLTAADARRGLEMTRARPASIDGLTYWTCGVPRAAAAAGSAACLLPRFDEYLVAYRDLDAVPRGRGALDQAVVVGGQVAATWSVAPRGREQVVDVRPLGRVPEREWRAVSAAAARYGRFLQRPVVVTRNGRAVSV